MFLSSMDKGKGEVKVNTSQRPKRLQLIVVSSV